MRTKTSTKLNTSIDENIHEKVCSHSRDEILDYLTSFSHKNDDEVASQLIKKLVAKKCKVNASKNNNVGSFEEVVLEKIKDFATIFAFIGMLPALFSHYMTYVIAFLLKLHSIRIDLLPDDIECIFKANYYRYVNKKHHDLLSAILGGFESVKLLAVSHFPRVKTSFASVAVLVFCSLLALLSSASTHNSGKSLAFRKYMPVNWNVNGQISNAEKEMVKMLLDSNQIKTLANLSNKDRTYVSANSQTSKRSVSPDTSFVILPSNSSEYVVNGGESVLSISKKYRVSITDLIALNPDKDLVALGEGDTIQIPNNSGIFQRRRIRPSSMYGRIPRNLIASRMISSYSQRFYPVGSSGARMEWPVIGSHTISSYYGPRWGSFHPGIDITAPIGTPIIATRNGIVVSSGWSGGYGKCVVIDHGNGIRTRYGHASLLLVGEGQRVRAGQVIARVGSTGWSTGPHLHYEVSLNGSHHNPLRYF